jgi:hypothetical protein
MISNKPKPRRSAQPGAPLPFTPPQSVLSFLTNLAGWFYREQDRSIVRHILAKAAQVASPDAPLLDRHFFHQAMIEFFYKDRDKPGCLDQASGRP